MSSGTRRTASVGTRSISRMNTLSYSRWPIKPSNKAKWLKESLDILTSPEFDFVFQASVHTLRDFDDTEYGLCDKNLNPRPAFEVFARYPKDWNEIRKRRQAETGSRPLFLDRFEKDSANWTRYGDGLKLKASGADGIRSEDSGRLLSAITSKSLLSGLRTTR